MEPEESDELATFRREWNQERLARRNQPPAPAPAPTASVVLVAASEEHPDPLPGLTASTSATKLDEEQPKKPLTALQLYGLAVVSEREGRLDDALKSYRQAFRIDADIDKLYHRTYTAKSLSRADEPLALHSPELGLSSSEFRFERTLQLTPDYQSKKEHRSVEDVKLALGSGAATDQSTHPSSTTFLLESLLRSISANPWERPTTSTSPLPPTSTPVPSSAVEIPAPAPAHEVVFIPADPERSMPIGTVPREVLLLVLKHLSLSGVLPPPKFHQPVEVAPTVVRGKGKKRTLKEEMRVLEEELGLEDERRSEWKADVESLERFARTCRAARVVSLDDGIWRDLCVRTYVPPHQISREESAVGIVNDLHVGDWRRCYIEHPRIRLDGVYIAVVTYLRRGESHQAYCAPTHLITFYRYLRFYPNGLAISLLTTDAPSGVVRGLNPLLRVKGLTIGRWRLRGDLLECWGMEDPMLEEARRKYSFRFSCKLRSTARGRMNKLELKTLATEHKTTFELESVPIKPTKPFFFSKVASYGQEMEGED